MGHRPEAGGSTVASRGFRSGPRDQLGDAFFDGHSNEAAPFSPRTVVVANSILPEEVFQDEPRVSASFADAAVRNGLSAPVDALASVYRFELVGGFEAAVFGHRGRPRDV